MDSRAPGLAACGVLWHPVGKGCCPLRKIAGSNPAGMEAWKPGGVEAWRLEAWILEPWKLVGLLAGLQDWIGLDWMRVVAR